ncbi:hypothetical protein [Novosphingobium sp.]|uniref:hypothetical protein n=1 Tax=Novosphingobium sp. TaxID=1874826 RepID=UPI003341CF38
MFEFGRKVFGRKSAGLKLESSPSQSGSDNRFARPGHEGAISLDWLQHAFRPVPGFTLRDFVGQMSVAERMELLRALGGEVALIAAYVGSRGTPETRAEWADQAFDACFRHELRATREDLPALMALITGRERYREDYYQQEVLTLFRLMREAVKDGAFLTTVDQDVLGEYAATLRRHADIRAYDKPRKRKLVTRAEMVEKFAGKEASATALLLERCDGAENPHALQDMPPNHAFWCELLGATVDGLHGILAQLKAKPAPAWLKNEAAFKAAFPPAGPFAPRFGAWADCAWEASRDFADLRTHYGRMKTPLAQGDDYRRLHVVRAEVEPMLRWQWQGKDIPALDALGDLSDPKCTALIEHLICVPNGPRPTAAWLKQAKALADAAGSAQALAQLCSWLSVFHSPLPTPQSLADADNAWLMDRTVRWLNEQRPDWPAVIAQRDMAATGLALAMELASGNCASVPAPFRLSLLGYTDHYWDRQSATHHKLPVAASVPERPDSPRDYGTIQSWQKVSLENEQLLRGAIWLMTAMAERQVAIATLEQVALSASARLTMGDDCRRSKVVANAAIASLIHLGEADVAPALMRLIRAIDDRTIKAAAMKALNTPV